MGDRKTTDGKRPRYFRAWSPLAALALAQCCVCAVVAQRTSARGSACRVAVVEGEVRAGESFERVFAVAPKARPGMGLKVLLEPIASGWILRVLPAQGPRNELDYAELATPPYHSVSPLSISTDFSFRAQDALAWNPRRFHFAADRQAFAELRQLYREYQTSTKDASARRAIEMKLAELAAQAPEGELSLLDAHLVQGTADQAGTAALVASHLSASAHEVEQPADGRSPPLGRLNWIRFKLRLSLPKGLEGAAGTRGESGRCE